MKRILIALGTGLALGAPAACPAAESVSGTYRGTVGDKPVTVLLHDSATEVTGRLTVEGGYTVLLKGKGTAGGVTGGASSPLGVATFELRPIDGGLILTLEEMAPVSGQTLRTQVRLSRAAAAPSLPDAALDATVAQRDPRLIGVWQGSRLHHAGDMVLHASAVLELHADGSFAEKAHITNEGSMSVARRGQWSTAAGALRIRPNGGREWTALGRYQVRDDALVLIGADGESEVWRRR
ncbi:MAG TPA: hypothetical protein VNM24_06375 [Burkholderiales bacterium]|nr:hypothetical protein [Burkholderiales bacterium]